MLGERMHSWFMHGFLQALKHRNGPALGLEPGEAHHVGKGDVEIGVGLYVEGGDLDRHGRVLGTREGEDIDVVRDCLWGAHRSTCHQDPVQ